MLVTAGAGHHAYAPQPTQGHAADLRAATNHGVFVPNMWRDDPRFEQAPSGKKRRIVTEGRFSRNLRTRRFAGVNWLLNPTIPRMRVITHTHLRRALTASLYLQTAACTPWWVIR